MARLELFMFYYDVKHIFGVKVVFKVISTNPSIKTNKRWVNVVNGSIPLEYRLKSVKSRSSVMNTLSRESENIKILMKKYFILENIHQNLV